MTSEHAHGGGQEHVNEGHRSADHAHHGGQDHVPTHQVISGYAHSGGQGDVTKGHVSADHGHGGGHDHVTTDHVTSGHAHSFSYNTPVPIHDAHRKDADHVALDHVTTDHAHKQHVTNDTSSSTNVITLSPEISQNQLPDPTARAGYIRSEVLHVGYCVLY